MLAMSWERLSCPGFNATWEGLPALSDQLLRKAWPMAEGTWPIGKLWWCLLAQTTLKWCWNMLNVGLTWFHCLCFTLCDRANVFQLYSRRRFDLLEIFWHGAQLRVFALHVDCGEMLLCCSKVFARPVQHGTRWQCTPKKVKYRATT